MSRGLRQEHILKLAGEYISCGEVRNKPDHPTNTCDPYTGSWTEKLTDLKKLKAFNENQNFITCYSNTYCCYYGNRLLNMVKYLLNLLIRIHGPGKLFLSTTVTLEIRNE
jgi:hypothetical protein